MEESKFVNGFRSWMETHHEVVAFMTLQYERDIDSTSPTFKITDELGTTRWYEVAEELTNKFEKLHEGRWWDGEFWEEVIYFLTKELEDYGDKV